MAADLSEESRKSHLGKSASAGPAPPHCCATMRCLGAQRDRLRWHHTRTLVAMKSARRTARTLAWLLALD
eukprot:946025-Pleurochrysis_carterae.AAC.1